MTPGTIATMSNRVVFVLAGFLAVTGCRSKATETREIVVTSEIVVGVQETRKITLTKGDSISITTDPSGNSTIAVTIAEGKRDAGTYTTSAEGLIDIARDAEDALNRPGVTVWIGVDADREIAKIGWRQAG